MYRPSSKIEKKIIIADNTSKVFLLLCIIVSIQLPFYMRRKLVLRQKIQDIRLDELGRGKGSY